MTGKKEKSPTALIDKLVGLGPLKVWSVVITIFGDYAQSRDDRLSAERLRQLTGKMGIRADALRVALHRLRKDGWISAERSGRNSYYRLTEFGFSQCSDARPRIYAASPATSCKPVFLIAAPQEPVRTGADVSLPEGNNGLQIAPRIFLFCPDSDREALEQHLVIPADKAAIPAWIRTKVGPAELASGYARFAHVLRDLVDYLKCETLPSAVVDTLRVLTIHRWRQLLLRHPDLPARFFPDDWQGENCRALVQSVLELTPELTGDSVDSDTAVT